MKRALVRSPSFMRAAKRYIKKNPTAAEAIRTTLNLLAEDVFDPRLRTHKLKGSLGDCWAASAGYDLRIVFEFVSHSGSEAILLLSIGTHDEVY
ncbi:MAG: plasmid stabilization protein [Planctomycetes bacterium RBG_16_55_9]|nr:MAG: plasmid stabilization protein [Planctomycetes bacterium RBG_16_55_9]